MKIIAILTLFVLLGGCASPQPIIPDAGEVEVSRDEPDSDCRKIGPVTGSVSSVKAAPEAVIEDLKKDAALKGANYVYLQGHSAMGTSASGTAYDCR